MSDHCPWTTRQYGPADLSLPVLPGSAIPLGNAASQVIRVAIAATAVILTVLLIGALSLPITVTVRASGTVEPRQAWPVRSSVSGVVAALEVVSGDTVRAGQVLIALDTLESAASSRRLRRELSVARNATRKEASLLTIARVEAQTNKAHAEAMLIKARASLQAELANRLIQVDLDTFRKTYTPGTGVSLDRALADLQQAEADLRLANARINELEEAGKAELESAYQAAMLEDQLRVELQRQRRSLILSPGSGVIMTDTVERLNGAAVQAGDEVLEIASLDAWRVTLIVNERDAPRVAVGNRVNIEVPALSEIESAKAWGVVEGIAREPAHSTGVAPGYSVRVDLSTADLPKEWLHALRRGYSVRGRIVLKRGTVAQLGLDWLRRRS